MKNANSTSGKGFLEIDWTEGKATLTTVTKDSEDVYDFFAELEKFNGKQVSFSIKLEDEVQPIGE